MSYNIKTIPSFDREIKKLAKKYPSLKSEFKDLIQSLKEDPTQGASLIKNCYKIRLAIKSKGKGKSGGARVITYIKLVDNDVYLISIYDKSEKDSISDKELKDILKQL